MYYRILIYVIFSLLSGIYWLSSIGYEAERV
jgi:hypothetical protein